MSNIEYYPELCFSCGRILTSAAECMEIKVGREERHVCNSCARIWDEANRVKRADGSDAVGEEGKGEVNES